MWTTIRGLRTGVLCTTPHACEFVQSTPCTREATTRLPGARLCREHQLVLINSIPLDQFGALLIHDGDHTEAVAGSKPKHYRCGEFVRHDHSEDFFSITCNGCGLRRIFQKTTKTYGDLRFVLYRDESED